MKKVLILGALKHRDELLQQLQKIGCVHLTPITISKEKHWRVEEELEKISKAMAILSRHTGSASLDSLPEGTVERILALDAELRESKERLAESEAKYAEMRKWGEFSSRDIQALEEKGVRFRFWQCPVKQADSFRAEQVERQWVEGGTAGVVTLSHLEEVSAPAEAREIAIANGTVELSREILESKEKIAAGERQMQELSGYHEILRGMARELTDKLAIDKAKSELLTHEEVFGLSGWVPTDLVGKMKEKLEAYPVALEVKNSEADDEPPTLLRNPRWIQSILDVVKLYATPGYQEWDTSASVYFAFAVFFGLIVGDAGYGCLLLMLMLSLRKKLMQSEAGARIFRLMITLSLSVIAAGALSATWFAISPGVDAKGNALPLYTPIIPGNDPNAMMWFSIHIGAIHLCLARLIQAIRVINSTVCLAEFGWMAIIWGGILHVKWQQPFGMDVLLGGLATVFLFTSNSWNPIKRIAGGLLGLIGLSQNLADVLSYLRLFALGLASAIMGGIFNGLAMDVQRAVTVPVLGTLLMVLILFMGHTINLVLAIMGGFIHGLRLNFLEFYRYCFEGKGYDYRPLQLSQK